MKKGILCTVYRQAISPDLVRMGVTGCTNGPTRDHDNILLVGPGIPEKHTPDADTPVLRLDRIAFGKRDRAFARPDDGAVMYQFGGNYIAGGDGYPFEYAIPVHDRTD